MIAFRITINENEPLIIGQQDYAVLTASITACSPSANNPLLDIHCHFGGLSEKKDHGFGEHFRWKCPEINLNDKIQIEVIESIKTQPPTKRFRSDKIIQEEIFTEVELKELRHKDYLELKSEFDPS